MLKWSELKFWKCGEWDVIKERLKDEKAAGYTVVPDRLSLFKSLSLCPFQKTKVCIIGQDPYPSKRYATGIAFSIPAEEKTFPASLRNIYAELCNDTGCSYPHTGSLEQWCRQGVLLWNAIPSCREGKPASHHWPEWEILTQEIVERLDERHCIFCLLGGVARQYNRYINKSCVITTSHPAPRGVIHGFSGSRIFSNINLELEALGKTAINWSLSNESNQDTQRVQRTS